MEIEPTKKRQRDSSNIIKWHYITKHQTGEPVGLRGYSHYNEAHRYEIDPCGELWEVGYIFYWNTTDIAALEESGYRLLKKGTLFECMEAAELYDEKIGKRVAEEAAEEQGGSEYQ